MMPTRPGIESARLRLEERLRTLESRARADSDWRLKWCQSMSLDSDCLAPLH